MTRLIRSRLIYTLLTFLLMGHTLFAVPSSFVFQANVADKQTGSLNGRFDVKLRLYDSVGRSLWEESISQRLFINGRVEIEAGTIVPVTQDILTKAETMGLIVDGKEAKVRMIASPYALLAKEAVTVHQVAWDSVTDKPLIGSLSGTLIASQIPSGFITSSMLAPGAFNASGLSGEFTGITKVGTLTGLQSSSLIESTSGGFKFPDGTIQTSAASPTTIVSNRGLQKVGTGIGLIDGTSAGQILKWNGSGWELGVESASVSQNVYSAGSGLVLQNATFSLTDTGVTAGTYGGSTQSVQLSVDSKGRITSATSVPITASLTGSAGGDLAGTYPNPTLAKFLGKPLSSTAPLSGQILQFDGTRWVSSSNAVSGTASGDLSGSFPNPTVVRLQGQAVSNQVPLRGYVLKYNGSAWTPSSNELSGTAGGDLIGTYPNPSLKDTGVTEGSYGTSTRIPVLTIDTKGRITNASTVAIDVLSVGSTAGGDLSGTYPNPSVVKLQGRAISSAVPGNGQILKFNGTSWIPTKNTVNLSTDVTGSLSTGSLSGVVGLSSGGTGASTAAGARTNLGLGALAVKSTVILGTDTTGTLPVGLVAGLSKLATQNSVSIDSDTTGNLPASRLSGFLPASQVGGLGALATQSTVNVNIITNTSGNLPVARLSGNVPVAQISGLGSLAVKSNVILGTDTTGSLPTASITGVFGVTKGGTGATTVSGARANLGLGFLSIKDSVILGTDTTGTLPTASITGIFGLSKGGTGATTPLAARLNLGAAASGVNTDITALTGLNTAISISQGGTGATTVSDARANLNAAASGANTDISSLSGLTTALSISQGGTGATTISAVRNNLGLGSIATKNQIVLSGNDVSGLLPVSKVSGLGALATASTVNVNIATNTGGNLPATRISGSLPVAQVSGLGALATASTVNVNLATNTVGNLPVVRVSGLGSLATASTVNVNIATNTGGNLPASRISGILPVAQISGLGALATQSTVNVNLATNTTGLLPLSRVNGLTTLSTNGTSLISQTSTVNMRSVLGLGVLATASTVNVNLVTNTAGNLPVARVSGLGTLATLSTVNVNIATNTGGNLPASRISGSLPVAQVSGLGALATASTVNVNIVTNTAGNLPVARVSGLGALATLSTVNVNIATNTAGNLPVARVSGLGALATLSTVNVNIATNTGGNLPASRISGNLPVAQVSGLGLLATASTVNVNLATNTAGSLPVARVSGLGALATLSTVNVNIATNTAGNLPVARVSGLGALATKGSVDLSTSDVTGLLPNSKVAGLINLSANGISLHNQTSTVNMRSVLGLGALATASTVNVNIVTNTAGNLPVARVSGLGALATLSTVNVNIATNTGGNLPASRISGSLPVAQVSGLGSLATASTVNVNIATNTGGNLPATRISGTLAVANGGSGATTLTGYVKGNGASAMTASTTIPKSDITGLGKYATQNVVSDLQGRTVAATIPSTNDFLKWTGTTWAPASSNYVYAYDTTTYSSAASLAFTTIALANATLAGWTNSSGTFTCKAPGVYMVTFTGSVCVSNITSGQATVVARKNATEIAGSPATVRTASIANIPVALSSTFIVSFALNDTLDFRFAGSTTAGASATNVRLISGLGLGTSKPSFSFTMYKIQ